MKRFIIITLSLLAVSLAFAGESKYNDSNLQHTIHVMWELQKGNDLAKLPPIDPSDRQIWEYCKVNNGWSGLLIPDLPESYYDQITKADRPITPGEIQNALEVIQAFNFLNAYSTRNQRNAETLTIQYKGQRFQASVREKFQKYINKGVEYNAAISLAIHDEFNPKVEQRKFKLKLIMSLEETKQMFLDMYKHDYRLQKVKTL